MRIEEVNKPDLSTEEARLAAVSRSGSLLSRIKNPSEAVQLAAVTKNGNSIRHIKAPSLAVQIAAVKQNGEAILMIDRPRDELWTDKTVKDSIVKRVLKLTKTQIHDDADLASLIIHYIKRNGCQWPELKIMQDALDVIGSQWNRMLRENDLGTEAAQMVAVKHDGEMIQHIPEPSEAVQLAAVDSSHKAIAYIQRPSEAVQLAAVKHWGSRVLGYIRRSCLAAQCLAFREDGIIALYDTAIIDPGVWKDKDVKQKIIKDLLHKVKLDNGASLSSAARNCQELRDRGCPWPEIDAIEKSLQARDSLMENVITSRRSLIKSYGELVYDGDPKAYSWRAPSIKRTFETIDAVLAKTGRRFNNLLIVKQDNHRWFLATCPGEPEVAFQFYYDTFGAQSFLYVDYQRYKMTDFMAMSDDDRTKLLSTRTPIDPAAVWRKERSLEHIGAALAAMDAVTVDDAIRTLGPTLLRAVEGLDPYPVDIKKLGVFLNYLTKIESPGAKRFALSAMNAFKKARIKGLLSDVKRSDSEYNIEQRIKYLKKHFDWPELDAIQRTIGANK